MKPSAFFLLATLVIPLLSACEETPSLTFRLVAEDVTPDEGCTSLGDEIVLEFTETTTDPTNLPGPKYPGHSCGPWMEFPDTWVLHCTANLDPAPLADYIIIFMYPALQRGTVSLRFSENPVCDDVLQVTEFENLDTDGLW